MVAESSSSSDATTKKDTTKDTKSSTKKKVSPLQHLLAGGTAGFVESSICHPLDTIKTRMQLRRQTSLAGRALSGSGGGGGSSLREASSMVRAGGASTAASASVPGGGGMTSLEPTGWKHRVVHPTSSSSTAAKAAFSTASSSSSSATFASTASATSTSTTTTTTTTVTASLGPFGTAKRIVQREGPLALYKGLTAVYTGIIPKMAIRFVSFEYYRDVLGSWHERYVVVASPPPPAAAAVLNNNDNKNNDDDGTTTASASTSSANNSPSQSVTFLAGLLSGLTEAIIVVTPAEVCKIRMQSQYHSMMDPAQRAHAKYKNVVQTALLVVKEEGLGALYKGVVPTMLRQGCNQAVNFTAYNWSKRQLLEWKKGRDPHVKQLEHWQTLVLGGLSGGMGPLVNNPLDVVKTRMQKQVVHPGKEPKYNGLLRSCVLIAKEEGTTALWKGITPRLMRIMPGQAITFMTYEAVTVRIEKYGLFD